MVGAGSQKRRANLTLYSCESCIAEQQNRIQAHFAISKLFATFQDGTDHSGCAVFPWHGDSLAHGLDWGDISGLSMLCLRLGVKYRRGLGRLGA